jgi:hypothetical protein
VLNALASGGLYSTPSDMARLAMMFMDKGVFAGRQFLSRAAVREMGTDQTVGEVGPATSKATRYGLGWDTVTQPGLLKAGFTAWMKGGDSGDYHAGFAVVPGQKLAVVVQGVAPVSSQSAETLCERILLHALRDRGALRRIPAPIAAVAPPRKAATAAQLRAITGFWAGNGSVFRVSSGSDPQDISVSTLGMDGEWHIMSDGLFMRSDGRFHRDGYANSVSVTLAGGRRYLIARQVAGTGLSFDSLQLAQKIAPGDPLSAVWSTRVGRVWVGVNEEPTATFWDSEGMILTVAQIPGLPGYVAVETPGYGTQIVDPGERDDAGLMFLQIPGFGSRDMNDLVIEERDGQEWARYGTALYRPLDGVQVLAEGDTTVSTDEDGNAVWVALPTEARVAIDAGTRWRLYDANLSATQEGTSYPAQIDADVGWLCLFAAPGTDATVHVTPRLGAHPVQLRAPGPRAAAPMLGSPRI